MSATREHLDADLLCHTGRAYPAFPDVSDETDAARDYESEDGRDDGSLFMAFAGLPAAFAALGVLIVCAGLIAAFWPH